MGPFHQYVEQIEGLSSYQQGLIAQLLEKETGAKIPDNDLKNPNSPGYKAAMTLLTVFVNKMIMLDEIAAENNKSRGIKEDRKVITQPYFETPETRALADTNNTKSTLLIDTGKLEALLRELEKDMVELNVVQNNVNNLNQQVQTLQNNLNQVNQQIQVAQTQQQLPQQNIQPQVVPQPQQVTPTAQQPINHRPAVQPTSHKTVHIAPIIPQHSQVMTKTSNPGMVQPYPLEVVRKRKTELEHQAERVRHELNSQTQKVQRIMERMEKNFELMQILCPSMSHKKFNLVIHNVHFQNMLDRRLNNPGFDSVSFSISMSAPFGSSS